MKVELDHGGIKVTRERRDPKIYNELQLLEKVEEELQRQGYDITIESALAGGHLIDNSQNVIMDCKDRFIIWFSDYALRLSYEDYNHDRLVYYRAEGTITK